PPPHPHVARAPGGGRPGRRPRSARPASPPHAARRAPNTSSPELRPDDRHERHHLTGIAPEVVRQRQLAVGHRGDPALGWRLAPQLQPAFEHHPETRRPYRVAEALQPAVGVHRKLAVEGERPGELLLPRGPPLTEAEVLHE